MRQDKVIIRLVESQLLAYAGLALTQHGRTTPNRRPMLTQAEVETFHERGIDLPAVWGQPLIDGL